MQERLAAQRERLGAFIANTRTQLGSRFNNRFGNRLGSAFGDRVGDRLAFPALTTFQWIVCALLALGFVVACLGLIGLRSGASELADGVRENTRVLSALHGDVLKSLAGLDGKVADVNQKLADLAVQLDDAIAAQRPPARAAEASPDGKGGGSRKAGASRAGRAPRTLTVRHGRDR